MALPMELGEAWHVWRLGPETVTPRVASGTNWGVFWMCWQVWYGRYALGVRTPWFQFMLSSGNREWFSCTTRWYGLRVHWAHPKNWNIEDGGILFSRGDETLSFTSIERMEMI